MNTLKEQPAAAMTDLSKTFFRAIQEKNLSFIKQNTQQGFIFSSPRGALMNKETFINNFILNSELKFDIFQPSDEQVVISDNASVVNCLLQVKLTDQTGFWERVTLTIVNEENKWLVLAWHATFIPEKNK